MSQVMRPEQDPGFLADVRSAVHVLVERPLLPLVSLIVWAVPLLLPPALDLVAAPIWVFAVGYPGTERLWLLRGLRGQPFTFDQAFRRTWGYFGRFFRLELFIAPPVAVGAGVGWLVSRTFLGLYLGLTAVAILLDFALTFVTPALAFSTRRAKEALAIGLRMIPSEWPRAALYVLVPPLAILLVAHLVPGIALFRRLSHDFDAITKGRPMPSIPESVRLLSAALSAVAAVVGLVFKGATAAFYVRRFDVPEYGASSDPQQRPPPPRPDISDPT